VTNHLSNALSILRAAPNHFDQPFASVKLADERCVRPRGSCCIAIPHVSSEGAFHTVATQAQVDANQANSQKSTGPKTEEGKARSSRNRLSHGFASSTRFMWKAKTPASSTCCLIPPLRAPARYADRADSRRANGTPSLDQPARYLKLGMTPTHLPVFIRYQTAAERSFYKAHTELLKIQKQRQNSKIGFESKSPTWLPKSVTYRAI